MKSFVYIVLVVLLGTVAVQGYGPKIQRNKHGDSHKTFHNKPAHGLHHKPHHHDFPQRQNHRPLHDHSFGPPNHHGHWDNSPVWDDRSDSWGNGEDRGSYSNYDSYGPDDSYSDERDRSTRFDSSPSYEDYGNWYDHFHSRRPCKPKIPPKTTREPIPTTRRPVPTSRRPIPTTHKIILRPTLPPHPAHTRFTPKLTTTTEAFRPNPTIPHIPRPTRTVGPIPNITTTSKPTWFPLTPPTEHTTHWEAITNSVPETTVSIPLTTTSGPDNETTTEEEGFNTISPEIQTCIESCLSTPEYNPVCGSNGQTFDNEGKLFCASSCGVNVTLRRRSVCPPPIWEDYDQGDETPGTPPPTTTTTESVMRRTTSLTSFQRCMRQCRITATFTPVCGSDLVTYINIDRLKCAQSCGEVVEVLCEKPCAACGFNPVTPKTTTTLRPTTIPYIGRSTEEPDVEECINACPVTSELNPVCGTNHVTYRNPSHLLCAQMCGEGVAVVKLGPCGLTTTTSTTTEALPPTLSPDVLSCIRRCPVTTEYDPVCGTDELTYSNLGNLHCSKFCGVDVELKHKSRCVDEFDLGPDGTDSTTSRTTKEINGNRDPVTTPSQSTATTSSLFTSRTTTTTAIPITTSTSTSTPTSTTTGPYSSSTLGFTIPNDVLDYIFGSVTTPGPTTKPKNTDQDEDIDLDPRFNTETDDDKETGRGHYSKIIFPD